MTCLINSKKIDDSSNAFRFNLLILSDTFVFALYDSVISDLAGDYHIGYYHIWVKYFCALDANNETTVPQLFLRSYNTQHKLSAHNFHHDTELHTVRECDFIKSMTSQY